MATIDPEKGATGYTAAPYLARVQGRYESAATNTVVWSAMTGRPAAFLGGKPLHQFLWVGKLDSLSRFGGFVRRVVQGAFGVRVALHAVPAVP